MGRSFTPTQTHRAPRGRGRLVFAQSATQVRCSHASDGLELEHLDPAQLAAVTAAEHGIAVLAGQAQRVRTGFVQGRPVREMLAGAMSQEDEQLLRRGYERLNASDSEGFLRFCATDFEMHDLPSLPGAGVHVGHDGARAWWARMCEIFGELRFDPEEILDAGDGRFVVVCHAYGRGTLSGASIDGLTFNIWTVHDGELSSCVTYDTHAEALAAAGLEEHPGRGPAIQPTELRGQSI